MKRRGQRRKKQSFARRALGLNRGRKYQTYRYEAAVPTVTREVRRSLLPIRLLSALIFVGTAWLIYWFSSDEMFYVSSLRVEGSWRVPAEELMAISGVEGMNIFWVDSGAIEQAIEELPDIGAARVRCSLPADCAVNLVERTPLFMWRQGDAQVWVGADGMVLPDRGALPEAIVLDVTGSSALKPGDQIDQELVTAVKELKRLKPKTLLYQYTEQYGLSYRDSHGWLVRLGEGAEIETKLQVLRALTEHLSSRGIAPAFVDVRYPEAPYYEE